MITTEERLDISSFDDDARRSPLPSQAAERRLTRPELFLHVADLLQSGRSVEVLGERGGGRSHLLSRLREHFSTLGWRTVTVAGMAAFRTSSLIALAVQGIAESTDPRVPPLVGAFRALADQVKADRTVFIIDDADLLDDASWGVITAVSSQHDVPVVSSRLPPKHPNDGASCGLSCVYSIDLPPMDFIELEATLERSLQLKIEPATMSRLFAKSGGNIGLAHSILDAAIRADRVSVVDGTARATGSLWTSALRRAAESLLRPLELDDVVALKTLAMLGPTELATAGDVLGEDTLLRLERARFALVVDAGGRRLVVVNPPLLVEYFRHDELRAERATLVDRIDRSLSEPAGLPRERRNRHDPALLVRLVHEQTRLTTLRAREAWQTEPTLANATRLLEALDADHAHDDGEVESLIAASELLSGDHEARAGWEAARARHDAYHRGNVDGAIARLRREAPSLGDHGWRLLARASVLETTFRHTGDVEPFADLDTSRLPRTVRAAVTAARAFWLLVRGEYDRFTTMLVDIDPVSRFSDELEVLTVYRHVLAGSLREAHEIAQRSLDAALASFDASHIRTASFLVALCAVAERRYDDAEAVVATALSLGQPVGEHPISYRGMTLITALFAVQRGNDELVAQQLSALDQLDLPDGPLPVLSRASVEVRQALAREEPERAARLARTTGDALWERGARTVACTTYIDGLLAHFDPADWAHCAERLRVVDVPVVVELTALFDACNARDGATARTIVEHARKSGRSAIAGRYAQFALGALDADLTADDRASLAEAEAGNRRRALPSGSTTLTSREREVAELIASGLNNRMIAEALVVSVRTIESHVNKLLKKSGAKDRQGIRDFVIATGIQS